MRLQMGLAKSDATLCLGKLLDWVLVCNKSIAPVSSQQTADHGERNKRAMERSAMTVTGRLFRDYSGELRTFPRRSEDEIK